MINKNKEYFSGIEQHRIEFEYVDELDDAAIRLAFEKKQIQERKDWLESYDPAETFVDHLATHLRYADFVNKELILFSVADCVRSIPSMCDGLKPG